MNQLHTELKELMACNRIRIDYTTQLSKEQNNDLLSKVQDLNKKVDKSISVAYCLVVKAGAMGKIEKLHITNFRDTLDIQFNANILQKLKDEEWLLDGVGFGKLKELNLIPTVDTPVKVKDVYEAFLRYNDKPMLTGVLAIQNSLLRLCNGNLVAIATGQPGSWGKIVLGETPFGFDVTSPDYWLVDKSLYKPAEPEKKDPETVPQPYPTTPDETNKPDESKEPEGGEKNFKSITVSGKVDVANYNQVFTSFIYPLMKNNVEVTITIKGKSTGAAPLTENSQQYKITKESASQLGLKFEVEE
jgi:hypothetical protein